MDVQDCRGKRRFEIQLRFWMLKVEGWGMESQSEMGSFERVGFFFGLNNRDFSVSIGSMSGSGNKCGFHSVVWNIVFDTSIIVTFAGDAT